MNSKTENEEKRRKLYQLNPKQYRYVCKLHLCVTCLVSYATACGVLCSGYAPHGQGRADEQQGLLPLATDPGGKEQQEMDDILEQGDSSVFIKVPWSFNEY